MAEVKNKANREKIIRAFDTALTNLKVVYVAIVHILTPTDTKFTTSQVIPSRLKFHAKALEITKNDQLKLLLPKGTYPIPTAFDPDSIKLVSNNLSRSIKNLEPSFDYFDYEYSHPYSDDELAGKADKADETDKTDKVQGTHKDEKTHNDKSQSMNVTRKFATVTYNFIPILRMFINGSLKPAALEGFIKGDLNPAYDAFRKLWVPNAGYRIVKPQTRDMLNIYSAISSILKVCSSDEFKKLLNEAKETPAEEAPAEETPAEEAPTEEAPAEEAPAQEAPAEEAPAEEAPAEEAPVTPEHQGEDPNKASAEEAPAEEAPVTPEHQGEDPNKASAEEAPAEEAPAEEAPTEEAPAEEAPAEEAPAEEPTAEEAPTEEDETGDLNKHQAPEVKKSEEDPAASGNNKFIATVSVSLLDSHSNPPPAKQTPNEAPTEVIATNGSPIIDPDASDNADSADLGALHTMPTPQITQRVLND